MKKNCIVCDQPFETNYDRKICCSSKCSIAREKQRNQGSAKIAKKKQGRITELEYQLQRCKNEMSEEQLIKAGF